MQTTHACTYHIVNCASSYGYIFYGEPINSTLNFRFNVDVIYLQLIIFLVINLKIKSIQSFIGAHRDSMLIHIFIRVFHFIHSDKHQTMSDSIPFHP
jgi:hypothetical protein